MGTCGKSCGIQRCKSEIEQPRHNSGSSARNRDTHMNTRAKTGSLSPVVSPSVLRDVHVMSRYACASKCNPSLGLAMEVTVLRFGLIRNLLA